MSHDFEEFEHALQTLRDTDALLNAELSPTSTLITVSFIHLKMSSTSSASTFTPTTSADATTTTPSPNYLWCVKLESQLAEHSPCLTDRFAFNVTLCPLVTHRGATMFESGHLGLDELRKLREEGEQQESWYNFLCRVLRIGPSSSAVPVLDFDDRASLVLPLRRVLSIDIHHIVQFLGLMLRAMSTSHMDRVAKLKKAREQVKDAEDRAVAAASAAPPHDQPAMYYDYDQHRDNKRTKIDSQGASASSAHHRAPPQSLIHPAQRNRRAKGVQLK
eukprot:PhM_4_TR9224/c0_g1_i2/m.20805